MPAYADASCTDADGSACEDRNGGDQSMRLTQTDHAYTESTHWKTTAMARPGETHNKRPALHGGDLNEDSE